MRRPFLFIILLFFVACAPKTAIRIAVPDTEQSKILEDINSYQKSLQGIGAAKAYAKVRVKIRGHQARIEEAVKIRFPFSFYFETLDDLGNTQFKMTSDGSGLLWEDYSQREYWLGELNEKNLRKFLPLAANLEETLGLFVGKMPLLDLKEAKVFGTEKSNIYLVKIPRGQIFWDKSQNVIVSLAFKSEAANLGFVYEGDHFHPLTLYPTKETDLRVPSLVKLKDVKTKNEIEINCQDLELSLGTLLVPQAFSLDPLPGAKRLDALP